MIEFWHPLNRPMVFLFGKSKIFISNSKKLFWLLIYGFCPFKTIQPFQKTESRLFNSSILSKLYLSQLFIRYSISLRNEKKHENSIFQTAVTSVIYAIFKRPRHLWFKPNLIVETLVFQYFWKDESRSKYSKYEEEKIKCCHCSTAPWCLGGLHHVPIF